MIALHSGIYIEEFIVVGKWQRPSERGPSGAKGDLDKHIPICPFWDIRSLSIYIVSCLGKEVGQIDVDDNLLDEWSPWLIVSRE